MEDISYSAVKSVGNTILWLMHRVLEDTRTDDELRPHQEELRLKQERNNKELSALFMYT